MKKRGIFALLALLALASCGKSSITVRNGHFYKDGQIQYFVGVNMWHATELGTSDPHRLKMGLDSMQVQSVKNIRIMATDSNIAGLRKVLSDMRPRGLYAVVCLNSGENWDMGEEARKHIQEVVYSFKNSNAVFSWEICDEPQIPVSANGTRDTLAFIEKIQELAGYIKSIDPEHLVCVGSEGSHCFGGDINLYKKLHECRDIDYITMHIWPADWGWVDPEDPEKGAGYTFGMVSSYLGEHLTLASELNKPLVIENFGFSKLEGFTLQGSGNLKNRDRYFQAILSQVIHSMKRGGTLAGCNMRGAGGSLDTPMEQYVIYPPAPDIKAIIDECNRQQNSSVTIIVPKKDRVLSKNKPHRLSAQISSSGQVIGMLKLTLTIPETTGNSPVLFSETKMFHLNKSHSKVIFDLSKVPAGRYKAELSIIRQKDEGRHDHEAVDPFIITIEE